MDFGLLPPEVNSGLMYAGAGPGPMIAAASAWNELAAELSSTALQYGNIINDLHNEWYGPSETTMATAANHYLSWLESTSLSAEQTAHQLSACIAAYETAFAATVPPPVIATNRSLLATLLATNFLGINTPAIMATEAQYDAMWAQDAIVMHSYARAALAAMHLSPFMHPPKIAHNASTVTNATQAAQSIASATASHASGFSSTLANTLPETSAPTSIFTSLGSSFSPVNNPLLSPAYIGYYGATWLHGFPFSPHGGVHVHGLPKIWTGIFASLASPPQAHTVASVTASTGRSALVGSLSVPSSWSSPISQAKFVSAGVLSHPLTTAIDSSAIAEPSSKEGALSLFSQTAISSLVGCTAGTQTVKVAAGKIPATEELTDPTIATILVLPIKAK